jgi:hypothetical protein
MLERVEGRGRERHSSVRESFVRIPIMPVVGVAKDERFDVCIRFDVLNVLIE